MSSAGGVKKGLASLLFSESEFSSSIISVSASSCSDDKFSSGSDSSALKFWFSSSWSCFCSSSSLLISSWLSSLLSWSTSISAWIDWSSFVNFGEKPIY